MATTDLYAVADFRLIPIGTGNTSVAEEIAECQRVLAQTGLVYKMHGSGTNIEGPWSKVSQAIHDCHAAVHAKGVQRIATDIRVSTRMDRSVAAEVTVSNLQKKEEKSKFSRRLSARVGDFFKKSAERPSNTRVDENPPKVDEPTPVAPLENP